MSRDRRWSAMGNTLYLRGGSPPFREGEDWIAMLGMGDVPRRIAVRANILVEEVETLRRALLRCYAAVTLPRPEVSAPLGNRCASVQAEVINTLTDLDPAEIEALAAEAVGEDAP